MINRPGLKLTFNCEPFYVTPINHSQKLALFKWMESLITERLMNLIKGKGNFVFQAYFWSHLNN